MHGLTLKENLQDLFSVCTFCLCIEPGMMLPQITVDAEITFRKLPDFIEVSLCSIRLVRKMKTPYFFRGSRDAGTVNWWEGLKHIKLEMVDHTTDVPIPGVALVNDFFQRIKSGIPVDICYTIEENTHGSKSFTQLMVKDIRG